MSVPDSPSLGSVATIAMGQSPPSSAVAEEGPGIPFLQGNAEFGTVTPRAHMICKKPTRLCQAGDILISVRAPVGALNKADQPYCIGRGLAAIRFHALSPSFGWHTLRYWAPSLRRVEQGTTFKAVNRTDLERLAITTFSEPEERLIAHTLDTVDSAIKQTERLIAKLRMMKKGLLDDLLTRGIDENGNLRSIGARKPWDTVLLKSLLVDGPRNGLYKAPREIGDGILLVGQTSFNADNLLDYAGARRARSSRAEQQQFCLMDGDLLVTRVFATVSGVGRAILVSAPPEPTIYESNMMRLRVDRGQVYPEYLHIFLASPMARQFIAANCFPSNQTSINQPALSRIPCPIPPRPEQEAILESVASFSSRISTESQLLAKLKWMKSGMMSDLLTGRVRVKMPAQVPA